MAGIPDDKVAEVRDRTDIVEFIGEHVSLRKAGSNFVGLCPFHQEKSPSFNVSQSKQFFHCFGCGKSGDVYTFLIEIEGKTFVEAVRELAKRKGIELPERSSLEVAQKRAEESERGRLIRLHDWVANWFAAELAGDSGKRARAYLDTRGLSEKTRVAFHLGYAPPGWDALVRALEEKKVPHELCERSGLIKRRDNVQLPAGAPPSKATHFDVFVDRVVYALTSPVGEVIGFGGRVLEMSENQPKYKNSPETLIYKKGENLFGLHLAKHAIRRSGRVIVVEGNFDVMTLHDCGLDETVAPQGTALTPAQIALLRRFAKEVVVMLDADPAGRAATRKAVSLLVESDMKAKVVALRAPSGQKIDPDDLARSNLPRLQELIAHATPAVSFYFREVASGCDGSVPSKVQAVEECVALLRLVPDPLARQLYVSEVAQLIAVDVGLVQRALRGSPTRTLPKPPTEVTPDAVTTRAILPLHRKLLAILAQHGKLLPLLTPDAITAIEDPLVSELLARVLADGEFDAKKILTEANAQIRDAVARALSSDEFATDGDPKRAFSEILAHLLLPTDQVGLERERGVAIESGDFERVQLLTAKIRSLGKTQQKTEGVERR